MQERIGRHDTSPLVTGDSVLRLADVVLAAGLVVFLLPVFGLVAATTPRTSRALYRFRGDQLPQLIGVLRGDYSFFRASPLPRPFSD